MDKVNDIIAGLTELRDTGRIPPGLDLDLVIKIVAHYGRKGTPKKALEVLFERFWAVYPRKVAKADAKKAFNKIAPDEELLQKMIKSLERDKRSGQWTKDNGQFIPYASTWLNGRRWEDEGEAVTKRNDSFDSEEFFELALKRSREKMAKYVGG